MKTGPYTLCHTDRGSIQWWAWPAVSLGVGMFVGVVLGVFFAPLVGIVAVAIDIMRWE